MAANVQEYPWFGVVDDDGIQQGDIFEKCPVFLPPDASLRIGNTCPSHSLDFS